MAAPVYLVLACADDLILKRSSSEDFYVTLGFTNQISHVRILASLIGPFQRKVKFYDILCKIGSKCENLVWELQYLAT